MRHASQLLRAFFAAAVDHPQVSVCFASIMTCTDKAALLSAAFQLLFFVKSAKSKPQRVCALVALARCLSFPRHKLLFVCPRPPSFFMIEYHLGKTAKAPHQRRPEESANYRVVHSPPDKANRSTDGCRPSPIDLLCFQFTSKAGYYAVQSADKSKASITANLALAALQRAPHFAGNPWALYVFCQSFIPIPT